MENKELPRLFTVGDVATILKVHTKTVQGYLRDGTIKGTKIGKSWYIDPEEIKRLSSSS
jgi:excisionase family DNA binding protein